MCCYFQDDDILGIKDYSLRKIGGKDAKDFSVANSANMTMGKKFAPALRKPIGGGSIGNGSSSFDGGNVFSSIVGGADQLLGGGGDVPSQFVPYDCYVHSFVFCSFVSAAFYMVPTVKITVYSLFTCT